MKNINSPFRMVAWASIALVAVFLGKDFILGVVDVVGVFAAQAR